MILDTGSGTADAGSYPVEERPNRGPAVVRIADRCGSVEPFLDARLGTYRQRPFLVEERAQIGSKRFRISERYGQVPVEELRARPALDRRRLRSLLAGVYDWPRQRPAE